MRAGCIKIGIFIVILSLVIYLVKNREDIFNFINSKIKNKKLFSKIIFTIIILLIILCIFIIIRINIVFIKSSSIIEENTTYFEEEDNKIEKESDIYKELIEKDYENQKYNEPYILDGFSYVEGTWKDGFVIQDELGNQYVWVPCTNKPISECIKLQRTNKSASPFINYTSCYNESYEEFIKSALENGGFYISRYELGSEIGTTVSKAGVEVLTNITRNEAKEIVSQMYNNINCEIINGYAYDTTLNWIEISSGTKLVENVIEIEEDEKILTGRASVNNIYDFCDNVLEYSLENLYDTIVVRGVMNSNSTEYTNNIFFKESRYCMNKQEKKFGGIIPVAIRTILYK